MSRSRYPRYWIEKKAHRKTGYPLGTIAYYAPDDRFATKVAVGILQSEKDSEATFLERWFSTGTDVRQDLTIAQAIYEFIEQHHVHRVAMVDRIIGCPHEEGKDYPMGEACPQCPFWANRDRWTGELITA